MLPRKSAMIPRGAAKSLCFFLILPFVAILTPMSCTPPPEQEVQWEFLEGPYAREITSLLPLQQAPGRLLAGMVNGDIFFSASNGRTWTRRTPAMPGMMIHAFIQHPDSPASIYARFPYAASPLIHGKPKRCTPAPVVTASSDQRTTDQPGLRQTAVRTRSCGEQTSMRYASIRTGRTGCWLPLVPVGLSSRRIGPNSGGSLSTGEVPSVLQ